MTDLLRCSDIQERLPLYVGGDLDPEGLETVRVHLSRCTACSERHGDFERAREALLTLSRASDLPPAGTAGGSLWPGVRAVLEREGRLASLAPPPDEGPLGARPTPLLRFRWRASLAALPLAAAAAAVFLVVWLGRGPAGVPEGPGSGGSLQVPSVAAEGTFYSGAPVTIGTPVSLPAGVLRRLAPGEATLQETATELPLRIERRQPGVATPNSLAGYR